MFQKRTLLKHLLIMTNAPLETVCFEGAFCFKTLFIGIKRKIFFATLLSNDIEKRVHIIQDGKFKMTFSMFSSK